MPTGTIKHVFNEQGYGCIRAEDRRELFFHRSEVRGMAFHELTERMEVTCEIVPSDKGPRAVQVRPLSPHRERQSDAEG